MFKEIVKKNLFSFHDSFDKWEDAIAASCQPMIDQKVIDNQYVQAIIDSVNKYGPYIVLAPNIAMPHCAENCVGVYATEIGFMKVNKPVHFSSEDSTKDAILFFVLASVNSEEHMRQMVELATLLSNKDFIDACLKANTKEDLLEIDRRFEGQ